MKTRKNQKYYQILDCFFYAAVLTTTILNLASAVMVYFAWLNLEQLVLNSYLYFIAIISYIGVYETKKQLFPDLKTPPRKGEYFVLVWLALTIYVAFDDLFFNFFGSQTPLFKQLLVITGSVSGIFISGKTIKYLLQVWLGKK